MGQEILDKVLNGLQEAGFAADTAYPGQKFFQISGTAAAVQLEKADWARGSVTVAANILCPAAMGGGACEREALRAAQILQGLGGLCIVQGCRYDGGTHVYAVRVLAEFAGSIENGEDAQAGFQVYLNGQLQKYVRGFSAEEERGTGAEYAMGVSGPVSVRSGTRHWTVRMEERIPRGEAETPEVPEGFDLEIQTARNREIYRGCCWKHIRREYSPEGVKRIRQAVAREREAMVNGTAEV